MEVNAVNACVCVCVSEQHIAKSSVDQTKNETKRRKRGSHARTRRTPGRESFPVIYQAGKNVINDSICYEHDNSWIRPEPMQLRQIHKKCMTNKRWDKGWAHKFGTGEANGGGGVGGGHGCRMSRNLFWVHWYQHFNIGSLVCAKSVKYKGTQRKRWMGGNKKSDRAAKEKAGRDWAEEQGKKWKWQTKLLDDNIRLHADIILVVVTAVAAAVADSFDTDWMYIPPKCSIPYLFYANMIQCSYFFLCMFRFIRMEARYACISYIYVGPTHIKTEKIRMGWEGGKDRQRERERANILTLWQGVHLHI